MRIYSSPAIILRHLDYGEADRIVTFLTPEFGRLKGFARGARQSRKRFGTALEPFAEVNLQWVETRGELISLREADLIALRDGLRRDLETIALASYGCELTEVLLEDAAGLPQAFCLLKALLDHLARFGTTPEARLLFEIRLLDLAGYMPHILHCAECFGPPGENTSFFSAARGGTLCPNCAGSDPLLRVDPLTLGTLGRICQTPLELFEGFRLSAKSLAEGQAILTDSLKGHLAHPLKSLVFLDPRLI